MTHYPDVFLRKAAYLAGKQHIIIL